jgi:carbon monoxide dehydrogenase subunit G
MIEETRTFVVSPPRATVVDYLKDFAHAAQWDPGTVSCVQSSPGEVQVGTTWRNVSKFRGKETELTYRLEELAQDRLVFVGENDTVHSTDTMTFADAGQGGTEVTYHAQIAFKGLAKLATPFLKSEFDKLGDQTREQLTRVLNSTGA